MARRVHAEGESLRAAVAEVVADLTDQDAGDVNVMIQADRFDDERGVALDVDFAGDERDEPRADEEPAESDEAGEAAEAAEEADQEAAEGVDPDLDREAEVAADFVEGILDILDIPGDLKIRLFDDHAEVEVINNDGGVLIGRRGSTLDAVQELLRCALQREFQRRTSVKVDVDGYRARRLEKLESKARDVIDDVVDSGGSERLEPMDVFERKAIHNLVTDYDGVNSRSQGREPSRRVVIEAE